MYSLETFLVALVFCAVYTLAGRLQVLQTQFPRRWLSLVREHGHAYRRRGRWLLAASVLAGWLTSAAAPVAKAVISRLFAFVAGGVVMTSMNEELPREREGRFWWFVLGAAGYAIVLLMV